MHAADQKPMARTKARVGEVLSACVSEDADRFAGDPVDG
jgi:hypothetical protein